MAILQATITSLDSVDESVRSLYEPNENGDGFNFKHTIPTQQAKEVEKIVYKTSEEDAKKVTAYNEILAKEAQAKEDNLRKVGDFDSYKEQVDTKHAGEMTAKDAIINQQRQQLDSNLINSELDIASKLLPDGMRLNMTLAEPHIKNKLAVKDGKVIILDPSGNPRVSMKEGSNDLMGTAEFMIEFHNDPTFTGLFTMATPSGSGSTPAGDKSAVGKVNSKSELSNLASKIAFIKANGQDAFNGLPN